MIQEGMGVYFNDRIALGKALSKGLESFRGKDAVILCLQESSLLTCLTMAMELRAWVYPLEYAPVYSKDAHHTLLGAINEDGNFCKVPDSQVDATTDLSPELIAIIEEQKEAAIQSIRQQLAKYDMVLDKSRMNGRDVIVVGDIITDTLPLAVAQELLSLVHPKSLSAAVGNATPEVAEQVRVIADKTMILDVISGVVFDETHYFEHTDAYSPQEKFQLTQHIASYWQ